MDKTTQKLVDYAMAAQFDDLSAATVHECKRRIIDTFACVVGAYDEPLSRMARAVAERSRGAEPAARVWGCRWQTSAEAAAFANGVMLRFLDLSDMYRVRSGGHPSDVISAIWAVAESEQLDGRAVINGVTLAYDVYCSFCDVVDINSKGWDQPVYGILGSVLGAGRLLQLNAEQMGNAVALALAPNMALVQSRRGELSAWKGCAGANAARNAVFAALLARDGFTGPSEVFEGKGGLWDIVGKFDWDIAPPANGLHHVGRTHMKCFPVCYHAQSAAQAAIEMRPKLHNLAMEGIRIDTYEKAFQMLGNHPSRWAPATRETADHSLPYVVAIALLDGKVTPESFVPERLSDPVVLSLMKKITVHEKAEYSAHAPESSYCRIQVDTNSGSPLVTEIRYPHGHVQSVMSDAELDGKFRGMFSGYGNDRQCEEVLQMLWRLENVGNIDEVSQRMVHRAAP